jgi:hypothetical protein
MRLIPAPFLHQKQQQCDEEKGPGQTDIPNKGTKRSKKKQECMTQSLSRVCASSINGLPYLSGFDKPRN